MPPDIKPFNNETKPSADTSDGVTEPKQSKTCLACGAVGVKNRCGGCRQVYFCNLVCQKRIWIAHRPTCQQVAANANANANADINTNTDNRIDHHTGTATKNATVADATPAAPISAMKTSPSSARASPRKKSVVLITPPMEDLVLPANTNINTNTDHPTSTPTVPPSKKHKKKKKKPRSNSLHAPASAAMATTPSKNRSHSLSAKKHVMWGAVHAREFTRFPGGGGAIPYDGSWALGLGSPIADVQLGTVLEVEELRLQELEARAKELTKRKRHHVREGETRQFDYKHGVRNPLFGRLSERERKKLFSEAELQHMLEQEAAHVHSVHKSQRRRSVSSVDEALAPTLEEDADFACVASEQLHEFVVIRDSRDDSCGCSCGDLVKKVAKMNLKKLQQFLSARGVRLPPTATKPEVLARAKVIAMQEQNCSNAVECECAKHGVPCHSNVCVGCAGDCWNPHKQYSYEKQHVEEYRREQLAKWKASGETHAVIAVV